MAATDLGGQYGVAAPAAMTTSPWSWYDLAKIAAAQQAQGTGSDGRAVLTGQNLLSILNPMSGVTYADGSVGDQPIMVNDGSGEGGNWVQQGTRSVYTPGTYSFGGQTFTAGLQNLIPADQVSSQADWEAQQQQLAQRLGLDPNGQYFVPDLYDNPTGNAGKDRIASIYQYDPATGAAVPVFASNNYSPSTWVGSGRPFVKAVGALAGAAAGLQAAGLGAGGAGGAEGLSGMDMAADAALGTGNNITTAGGILGSSGVNDVAGLTALDSAAYTSGGDSLLTSGGAASASGGGSLSTIGQTLKNNADLIKLGIGAIGTVAAGASDQSGSADAALEAQRRAADNTYALGQDQLAFAKQQWEEGRAARDKAAATADEVSQQLLASQRQADAIAKEYEDYRKSTFQPLEQQIVSEATNYDTPDKRAAAARSAIADVDMGYAGVRDATNRQLASMGINPGSARAIAALGGAGVDQARASAGAAYSARKGVEDTGTAMKLNAASLGRNLPANQNASANTAINAGTSAVNAGTAPATIANSNVNALNSAYTGAVNAANSAGNLYGSAANIAQRGASNNAAAWGALGSTVGSYLGSDSGSKAIDQFATWISDENVKSDVEPVDGDEALAAVNATPVKKWRYDAASMAAQGLPMDDGEQHVGPMAQDVNATMGEKAAPGGKRIDPITMAGITMRAVQAVDGKVNRLAKQVSTIASMVGGGQLQAGGAL